MHIGWIKWTHSLNYGWAEGDYNVKAAADDNCISHSLSLQPHQFYQAAIQ